MRAYIILLLLVVTSCVNNDTPTKKTNKETQSIEMATGIWRLQLDLGQDKLPFNFNYTKKDGKPRIVITNAKEQIEATHIIQRNDSIFFETPLFPSKFFAKIISPTELSGQWVNYGKSADYILKFTAKHGEDFRFKNGVKSSQPLAKKWEVHFSPDNPEETYPAIGLFENKKDNIVYGTFATETGDYRFLEGNIVGDSLFLSCFDGAHAFLFKAKIIGQHLVGGVFYSGKHWEEPWEAMANPDFELTDPDALTKADKTTDWKQIKVSDANGRVFRLSELNLDNKVTIIQILGSWCPNCVDESKYYAKLYDQYHDSGLEIIGVAFEKKEVGLSQMMKIKERLDLPYNIYLGGERSKGSADSLFTMLDKITSFPTSIIIDRKGEIQRVHTGFYGPGTGEYYTAYVEEMDGFIGGLLD